MTDHPRQLTTPRIRVTMLDGSEHEVQVLNIDLVMFDRDRAKHHWPSPQDAPYSWLNYLAWHSLTKTQGLLPNMTLREFEQAAAQVESAGDDDDEADAVDPTTSGHELE
jgi:hypothetical protein